MSLGACNTPENLPPSDLAGPAPGAATASAPVPGPAAPRNAVAQNAQAETPPRAGSQQRAARPAPAPAMTAAAPAQVPKETPKRYALGVYAQNLDIYDKPYGSPIRRVPEASLPRAPMPGGGAGVPVYDVKDAFVRLGLPDGDSGWVKIELLKLSAKPCTLTDPTTRRNVGPVGAGSSDVACD